MEIQHRCFNEFPYQCVGCPEYSESLPDPTLQLALQTWNGGILYPRQYRKLATEECKLYHKRKVEYPEK